MTGTQWLDISSWGLLAWAASASVVLIIQLIAGPDDRQEWSAVIAVALLAILLWRTFVAYRFGFALGSTEQGIIVFLAGAAGWAWFGYCSWEINRGLYLPMIRSWARRLRVKAADSFRRWRS